MTIILSQITCLLCNIKIHKLKWKEHRIKQINYSFVKTTRMKILKCFWNDFRHTSQEKQNIQIKKVINHVVPIIYILQQK